MNDTNAIIRAYLVAQDALTAIVGTRIYCPRLPERATLPAIGFFVRGGFSTPYIPGLVTPSVQFDCWANSPIGARAVYGALYDALQGAQNRSVTIDATTYYILSAREDVQGQDLQDIDILSYYRVLALFSIMIR